MNNIEINWQNKTYLPNFGPICSLRGEGDFGFERRNLYPPPLKKKSDSLSPPPPPCFLNTPLNYLSLPTCVHHGRTQFQTRGEMHLKFSHKSEKCRLKWRFSVRASVVEPDL